VAVTQANCALYNIVICRLRWHRPTTEYMVRRLGEGRTRKEIIRCLKRYIAIEVHRAITTDLREALTDRTARAPGPARQASTKVIPHLVSHLADHRPAAPGSWPRPLHRLRPLCPALVSPREGPARETSSRAWSKNSN
jgi:hypothetical protein